MSITTITPEGVDAYGRFFVVTRKLADGTDIDPATGQPYPLSTVMAPGPHRVQIGPGSWDETGAWVPTDMSGQDATIQAFAASLWSSGVVAAFKAAFPWVDPAPELARREAEEKAAADRVAAEQADFDARVEAAVAAKLAKLAAAAAVDAAVPPAPLKRRAKG